MAQSLAKVIVHIIFSTKNRFTFLEDPRLRKEVHSYLSATLNAIGCQPIAIGGISDHVHILTTLSRTIDISQMMMKVKYSSSIWIKERTPELLGFSWQNGYGIFSVDPDRIKDAAAYIQDQEKHHLFNLFSGRMPRFL